MPQVCDRAMASWPPVQGLCHGLGMRMRSCGGCSGHSTVLTDGQADKLTLHGGGTVGKVMANVPSERLPRKELPG